MKFDLSKIEFSNQDLTREIKLLARLTEDLAEFIGIMIGDGHLGLYIGKQRRGTPLVRSNIVISGNINEKAYHYYVRNLFCSIFNTTLSYEKDTAPGAVVLRAFSKGAVQYLHQFCGIPLNRKIDVSIPKIIKNSSKNIKCAFLRGLADTDFSLTFKKKSAKGHNYPVITATFKSKRLVKDICVLLREMDFIPSALYDISKFDKRTSKVYVSHDLYLNGRKNLKLWLRNIGFSNDKFIRKVKKWQIDGLCPPNY